MAENTQNKAAGNNRKVDTQTPPYLDHGVPSSVAMDNPDDSQLGADRTQSEDMKKG
jgi:hypothetical protein